MNAKKFFFLALTLFCSAPALGQTAEEKEGSPIFGVMKDAAGGTLEGYLLPDPQEVAVASKDNEEKLIPAKFLKSITLEKVKPEGAAMSDHKQESKYSVRVENSQEIYTLRKKFTFSLNTTVGVVTRSIDPEAIHTLISKYASQAPQPAGSDKEKPLFEDKSVVLSLEVKF